MMKMSVKTVSGKLMLAAGLVIALSLGGFSAGGVIATTTQLRDHIVSLATEKADATSKRLAGELTNMTSSGTSLAAGLSGLMESGVHNRADVIGMLKAVPGQYKNMFGVWMTELPDAPADLKLQGTDGTNQQGRFAASWTKDNSGKLTFSTWEIKTTEQWYAEPLATGKGLITQPYLSTTGKLLTSVSVPIVVKGKTIGLAGVDLRLDDLAASVNAMTPFEHGHVMLLADNGKWLAHPDKTLVMKDYADAGAAEIKAALSDGKMRIIRDLPDHTVRIVYPFTGAGMNKTWAVLIDIPEQTFTAPIKAQIKEIFVTCLFMLGLGLALIYGVSTMIVRRPLAQLVDSVRTMASGNYDKQVAGANRTDEFGMLGLALDQFRRDLANGRIAQQEQEALRQSVEKDRERQAGLEKAKAEELVQFVQQVQAGFDALAAGDLTVRMQNNVAPEFEAIRQNFNTSVAALEEAMGSVVHTVGTIRSGLGEISSAANDLARRTEQQAASLEETIAALSDVSRAIDGTAEGAGRAQQAVKDTRENAAKGGNIVARAIDAMTAIQGSSEKIGNIIGVIDEIAFQTNLLALNAGVEAARAGESGKGFAVVAQEVRELAQRSANAAREIKELISTSSAQVDTGVDLVSASGASLQQIVDQVANMSSTITDIANSAREQANSLREVTTAGDVMDKVTQQNAAMVEETTAATQGLMHETENLAHMVERFRTRAAPNASQRYAKAS
jgi:methyl-accepting chemotaxis protein